VPAGRPPKPLSAAEENCRKSPCPVCPARPGEACKEPGTGYARKLVHFPRREAAIRDGHHNP
jgi:hypothetical protein